MTEINFNKLAEELLQIKTKDAGKYNEYIKILGDSASKGNKQSEQLLATIAETAARTRPDYKDLNTATYAVVSAPALGAILPIIGPTVAEGVSADVAAKAGKFIGGSLLYRGIDDVMKSNGYDSIEDAITKNTLPFLPSQ